MGANGWLFYQYFFFFDARANDWLFYGPGLVSFLAVQWLGLGSTLPYWHTLFGPAELCRAFAQLRRTAAPGEQFGLQVVPTPARVRVRLKSQRQTIELTRTMTDTGL